LFGCGRTRGTQIPPRLISHRATPVKVVRAPRGSTFPGGRFSLVAALLGASARDSACRGKPGAVAPPISRKDSGKAHGSRRPTNMRIYEASIAYNLVELGDVQALTAPDKIAEYLCDGYAKNPCQESLWVVCLDRRKNPISRAMVTLGTLACALAHPGEVFKIAILASAASIVVSHNHPSGDPSLSTQDVQVTRQLRDVGKIIGIDLLDNVFVERLWRTVKYEEVYLSSCTSQIEAETNLAAFFRFYNERRPHSSLGRDATPMEVYRRDLPVALSA
jgi:DNA repair protein RadC